MTVSPAQKRLLKEVPEGGLSEAARLARILLTHQAMDITSSRALPKEAVQSFPVRGQQTCPPTLRGARPGSL